MQAIRDMDRYTQDDLAGSPDGDDEDAEEPVSPVDAQNPQEEQQDSDTHVP